MRGRLMRGGPARRFRMEIIWKGKNAKSELDHPAEGIGPGTPLDAGEGVIQALGQGADLAAVDHHVLVLPAHLADGEMTAAVPVPQASFSVPSAPASKSSWAVISRSSTFSPQDFSSSRQDLRVMPGRTEPVSSGGEHGIAHLEHDVHGAHFLNILSVNAV